jgi:hypothetical protein
MLQNNVITQLNLHDQNDFKIIIIYISSNLTILLHNFSSHKISVEPEDGPMRVKHVALVILLPI